MNFQIDQRTDEEFLRDILKAMSPRWLLNKISTDLVRFPELDPKRRMWSDIHLSAISGYPSREKDAAINAQADARQRMLKSNPTFRAALDRIKRAGVKAEWDNTNEYSYSARLLRLVVPAKALPRLQEMAAEDAGIDAEQRSEAAELYRRWLLQNYHPEWESYRQQWPLAEDPYYTARNDFGRDPTQIQV
jgi:hypothetical protein